MRRKGDLRKLAWAFLAFLLILCRFLSLTPPTTNNSIFFQPSRTSTSPRHDDPSDPGALVDVKKGACSMPVLDPWDSEIRDMLKPAARIVCDAKRTSFDLVRFNRTSETLSLDAALHESLDFPECSFRCLPRQDDSALQWGQWGSVNASVSLPSPCPVFHLQCRKRRGGGEAEEDTQIILDGEVHDVNRTILDRVMDNLQASRDALKRQEKGKGRPDVVILFLDATSLSNAKRYAPRLLGYLEEELGSVVMEQHSVVGPNTNPNLFPLLTGRRYEELKKASSADDLPIIWKNFSQAGYVTAYTEDASPTRWAIFSSVGRGFTEAPADAYGRTWMMAVDAVADHDDVCVGHEGKLNLWLDYVGRFLRLHDRGPAFVFAGSHALTHDWLNRLPLAEKPLMDFVEEHKERLERSFVVVMGDHGNRLDSIRETEVGRLETRLPLMALSVPKSARERLGPILKANAKHLTSHFDTFVTLVDILDGGWASSSEQRDWSGVSQHGGQSLLRRLPSQRSCGDAGIPADYCLCGQGKALAALDVSSELVQRAAEAVVRGANQRIQDLKMTSEGDCAQLTLASVRSARRVREPSHASPQDGGRNGSVAVVVVVEAAPSRGLFEATLSVPAAPDRPPTLLSPIDRVNKYGNQSSCVIQEELRSLCFCI